MMVAMRWLVATIMLFGAGWVASACGASIFACSTDAQCETDAAAGMCQPDGYCSFPDESCSSGQRFGEAAPAGVASECVEPSDAASSTMGPDPVVGSDGIEPPDPDGGTEGSTTLPPSDDTTTMPVGEDGASTGVEPEPTTGTGSEGTTTDADSACPQLIVDPFDGVELLPMWSSIPQLGTELVVENGQLVISMGPSPDAWIVAGAVMEVDSLAGGWERLLITDVDESGLPLAGGLVISNETCTLQLFLGSTSISASVWNSTTQRSTFLGEEPLPGFPLWLQLREDGAGSYFEWSFDAVDWNELAFAELPECGDLLGPVITGVNVGGQLADGTGPGIRTFDQIELCLP